MLDRVKTREFWHGIWEKDVKHNETKDWIQNAEEESEGNKQQNIEKNSTLTNWKAP